MQDQLISFETAKLAKEKGFILGIGWHGIDGKFYHDGQLTYNHRGDNPCAPTQSLLQKWLREKHDTHINVGANGMGFIELPENEVKKSYGYSVAHKKEKFTSGYASFFSSYEAALEQGLFASLKLIK